MSKKVLTIVGARPQFIKAAAVSRAFKGSSNLNEVMVHTGQHFDSNMSDIFFSELGIPAPAYNLDIHGGGHGQMTGRMLEAIEGVIESEQPDWLLVYGDTNSTLAGALAAAKLHIPVAHVEAGLRSFNRRMPEEVNRVLTDHVSSLLFCPTQAAVENLKSEGISAGVHHVGDVMYDATLEATRRAAGESCILSRLGIAEGEFLLATIHRAENTETPEALSAVFGYLRQQAGARPVVLPLHPRTRIAAERYGIPLHGFRIIDPVGYLDMTRLLSACAEVLTDSGGLQKEAYFHRKPCTTLRSETEWVETVSHGWNRLWTADAYAERRDIADYGDGRSALQIVHLIEAADRVV